MSLTSKKEILDYLKETFESNIVDKADRPEDWYVYNVVSIEDLKKLFTEILTFPFQEIVKTKDGDFNKVNSFIQGFKTTGTVEPLISLTAQEAIELTDESFIEIYNQPRLTFLKRFHAQEFMAMLNNHLLRAFETEHLTKPVSKEFIKYVFKTFYSFLSNGLFELFVTLYDKDKPFEAIIEEMIEEYCNYSASYTLSTREKGILEVEVNPIVVKYFLPSLQSHLEDRVLLTDAIITSVYFLEFLLSSGVDMNTLYELTQDVILTCKENQNKKEEEE